jgi:hypothetical protein
MERWHKVYNGINFVVFQRTDLKALLAQTHKNHIIIIIIFIIIIIIIIIIIFI